MTKNTEWIELHTLTQKGQHQQQHPVIFPLKLETINLWGLELNYKSLMFLKIEVPTIIYMRIRSNSHLTSLFCLSKLTLIITKKGKQKENNGYELKEKKNLIPGSPSPHINRGFSSCKASWVITKAVRTYNYEVNVVLPLCCFWFIKHKLAKPMCISAV